MIVDANGIRYQVKIHRQRPNLPSLLLIHGFMGSGEAFEHLIQELARFVNPITPDLLGHGETEGVPTSERYSLEKQLADIDAIISELDQDQLYLHGYSMGGRLALRYALAYPERLSGLILESSNYGIERDQDREKRLKTDAERARKIRDNYIGFLERWNQLPLFNKGIGIPDRLLNNYHTIQRRQNPAFMAASLKGFGTGTMASVKNKLDQLHIPALLLAGERDVKYVEILSEMNSLLPNCTFHIVEKAGHRVHLENPEAFVDHIKDFIDDGDFAV